MFHSLFLFLILLLGFLNVKGDLDILEGSSCIVEGENGTCVNVYRCLSLILKDQKYPPVCSFQGSEPVVCCQDCELVEKRYRVINPNGEFLYKNGQKSWDNCLSFLQNLDYSCKDNPSFGIKKAWNKSRKCYELVPFLGLVGGFDAVKNQYPHMALLGYGDDVETAEWLCGGTLISERFILTAGHCSSSPALGPVTFVALGILKRTDPIENWKRYRVKKIIRHPDYKPPSKYNDIALLETDSEIKMDRTTLPACLPVDTQEYPLRADTAYVTGWGALGPRDKLADNLQTASLQRFSFEECSQRYPQHRLLKFGVNGTTQICYGERDVIRDTCQGDSGGPLQILGQASTCMYTVVGVTSYGRECGHEGTAGIYTRVLDFVPWIEDIVWPDD